MSPVVKVESQAKVVTCTSGVAIKVEKGVKGDQGDNIIWDSEWAVGATYDTLHAVSRGGQSWISLQDGNVGHDPLTDDGTWWDCMVSDSLAEAARDKAEQWAEEAEDVEVETGEYSAYHWARKAQDATYTTEMIQRLDTMGGILI